ncbi:MAG TPA: acyl carrier protein [Bacilli bacterium]|nr:acyl carrier protein [Bacilli bacterium]
MFEKLKELISKELSVDKEAITKETHIQNDLGADSLDAVELVMSIEDAFHISLPDDAAQNFRTVNDILVYLQNIA